MSAAETAAFVAVPTIIENVARAMYEDSEGRVMADKDAIPDWEDVQPYVWRYWHRIAHVALAASAHSELCAALEELAEWADRYVDYVDVDPLLGAARIALAKARGEQVQS